MYQKKSVLSHFLLLNILKWTHVCSPMTPFFLYSVVISRFISVDGYGCTLFSLQYTIISYKYTRIYLSRVPLMGAGNVFSFF